MFGNTRNKKDTCSSTRISLLLGLNRAMTADLCKTDFDLPLQGLEKRTQSYMTHAQRLGSFEVAGL